MFPVEIFYAIISLIVLVILFKVFAWPIKMLGKLIINGILGVLLLVVVNFIGGPFGINIGVNIITALIAGFFGIPGVIVMVVFKLFF